MNLTITNPDPIRIILSGEGLPITIEEDAISIVSLGPVIYAGGIPQSFQITAGENLSALRVIRSNGSAGFYADAGTPGHADQIIGLSVTAALAGAAVTIRHDGEVQDAGLSLSAGPIYCGAAGALTQTAPASGFVRRIGTAIASDRFIIEISQPILIS